MRKNIEQLLNSLKQGKPVVVATILSKQGSAPRSAGTKMLVHEDGHITGTIGGGWLEAHVQTIARKSFDTKKGASIQNFTLDSVAYADMDMVCGGNVSLLIEYIPATEDNSDIFSKLLELLTRNQNGFMVSRLSCESSENFEMERCIICGGRQIGVLQFPKDTIENLSEQAELMRSPGLINIEDEKFFIEPAQFNGSLYILGAGHLGIETARIAHGTGFKIVVMDDRAEFANEARFPMAQVHVVDKFENCFDRFTMGHGSYIVIMTRGHLYDRLILEQAIKTNATYIGMIGSRSKKKVIYDHLLTQGVNQEQLDQVHAPIGLSIGAQTPAEIAVSIVAELIQARFSS